MTRIIVLALGLMLLGLSAVALWVTASPAPENELQRQPKLLGRLRRQRFGNGFNGPKRGWFARKSLI
jgi:hypothetical protein